MKLKVTVAGKITNKNESRYKFLSRRRCRRDKKRATVVKPPKPNA